MGAALWVAMDTYAPCSNLAFCLAPSPSSSIGDEFNSYFVFMSQFVTTVHPLSLLFFLLFLSCSYCSFRIVKCMENGLRFGQLRHFLMLRLQYYSSLNNLINYYLLINSYCINLWFKVISRYLRRRYHGPCLSFKLLLNSTIIKKRMLQVHIF